MEVSESPDALVKSRFKIRDYMVVEDGSMEYRVEYDSGSKHSFMLLSSELAQRGFTARLHGTKQDATLVVSKELAVRSRTRAPIILLSLTVISVIITGLFLSSIFQRVSPSQQTIPMAAGFTVALAAVLGLHELAHRYLSGKSGKGSSVPYYIPNIPVFSGLPILSFLPTFGSVTYVRAPMVNKDSLFDLYFVGPFVGMLVALVVSVFGVLTSTVLSSSQFASIFTGNSNIVAVNMNQSVLQTAMKGLLTLAGLSPRLPSGSSYISSPIEIAAWVGFLVTFLNLLPAAAFDGGVMTNLVVGVRGARVITAITGLALLVIDTPNYWVVVLLIFLLGARQAGGETLDSLSKISSSKKMLYVLSLILLVLCAPIPQHIATISLGSG